jgi:hypothetical protein
MRGMRFTRSGFGTALALVAIACQTALPAAAWAHGGGGHFGGGGGGFHGGGGGRPMGGGGFDGGGRDFGGGGRDFGGGGRDFGGDRDFGGGRDFGGDRGFDGARGFDGGRPDAGRLDGGRPLDAGRLDGGRALDGGRPLDGGRALDGGAARELGGSHFAGAGNLSRADFQRIAAGGVGRDALARGGVRPYSTGALADRGNVIRNNFYHGGWYGGRGWYANHFRPWWPGGWWGGFGWGVGIGMMAGLAWGDLAGWGGYGAAPVAYNYGTTICYQDDGVYVQGERVGTAEEYAQQAATLAGQGSTEAKVPGDDQWRPLGVFAVARAEETNPSTFISLAIDKDGLLRGTYYDAVSDATQNLAGKVDKKTQRAAWTFAGKTTPVYEAGLSNLTQDQTTILVHRDGGKTEQLLLVRVKDDQSAGSGSGAASGPSTDSAPTAKPRRAGSGDDDPDVDTDRDGDAG